MFEELKTITSCSHDLMVLPNLMKIPANINIDVFDPMKKAEQEITISFRIGLTNVWFNNIKENELSPSQVEIIFEEIKEGKEEVNYMNSLKKH